MKRFLFPGCGFIGYVVFFVSFLDLIALVGNLDVNVMLPKSIGRFELPTLVPKTIDSGALGVPNKNSIRRRSDDSVTLVQTSQGRETVADSIQESARMRNPG
jgi:hypothetical protein